MGILDQISSEFGAQIVLISILGIVIGVFSNKLTPAQAFISAILLLIVTRVVDVNDFLISFSNKQVITIFILIFITVAIRHHFDINRMFSRMFPDTLSGNAFLFRLSSVVAFFSAFLNNTPIVAMLMFNVQQWAKKKNMSPSKFLIPLSYAAMLGGMITVIGTSTNLVLQGLIASNHERLLHFADFAVVGLGVTLVGIIYLGFFSKYLLPDRKMAIKQFAENVGEYVHEVELMKDNDLIGKSVQDAGFKNLQGIYLVEISRNGELITPVSPSEIIENGDHFYFAGDTEILIDFVRDKKGLMLSSEEKLEKVGEGNIVEVVIAANSKLSGILVKDSDFRLSYNASIIGIHRNGEKVSGKIGHVKLRSGDLLLLLTGNDFGNRILGDKNLYLLSELKKAFTPPAVKMSWLYKILQVLVLAALVTQVLSFFIAILISLFLLVFFNFINVDHLKRNFNFDLLIVLACSLTLGKAFIDTGAANQISEVFLGLVSVENVRVVLFALFLFTAMLTSLITNVAAVSIAFPIAFALAHQLGVPGAPFYLTIAFAASAAFLTPMAYQTNMMVYGPGGYKSIDFFKVGLPLLILYMVTSLAMIYWWFEI